MSGPPSERTAAATGGREHVFVSPHLDDVVLSCGGTLARLRRLGCRTTVVTVFAAEPPVSDLSPFAQRHLELWGAGPHAWRLRRLEDNTALQCLGARGLYGQHVDAPFRRHPVTGRWLYQDNQALFGPVDPAEGDLPRQIAGEISTLLSPEEGVVYVPLGVGNHVDHQLLAAAGHQLRRWGYRVFWYEEFPYACRSFSPTQWEARGWTPWIVPLQAEEVRQKVQAILCYQSQLPSLFGDARHLERLLGDYMLTVSRLGYPAERFWTPNR